MIKRYGKVVITEDDVSIEEFHFDGTAMETGGFRGEALVWALARIIETLNAEGAFVQCSADWRARTER